MTCYGRGIFHVVDTTRLRATRHAPVLRALALFPVSAAALMYLFSGIPVRTRMSWFWDIA